MITISVDPGANGSLVVWEDLQVTNIQNIPYKKYPTIGLIPDFKQFGRWVIAINPDLVVFENIGASPTDGIASAAKFTKGFGILIGCCADVERVEFVQPSVWKCGTGTVNKPKKATIAKALSLHPEAAGMLEGYKNINDRADAILIGHFYLKVKEKLK